VQAGDTALHFAGARGAPNELLKVLIDAGADIAATNNEGKTHADVARWNNKTAAAIFLDSFVSMPKSANMMV
jgi:ankyrin repeat protein